MSQTNKTPANLSGWYVARVIGEIGFIIAIPLVALLLLGIYIDTHLHTKIIFTIAGILGALSISIYSIYQKIKAIQQ